MKLTRILATLSIAGLALAGYSSPADNSAAPASTTTVDSNTLTVVTSTQIWADVADAVSPDVDATAIITGDSIDPHSFEATAADIAKAKAADFVVVGGGGYDAWLYSALGPDTTVIHALPLVDHDHDHAQGEAHDEHTAHDETHEGEGHADEADADKADGHAHGHEGHDHATGNGVETNEHIWYDIDAVDAVAEQIAAKVAELDPKATIDSEAVAKKLAPLHDALKALPARKVAQTEPIADYILAQTPMQDVTPEGYRDATLDEQEPSAKDVAAFLKAIEDGEVELLIFNPQTATPTTEKIRDAATAKTFRWLRSWKLPPWAKTTSLSTRGPWIVSRQPPNKWPSSAPTRPV